jgi:hypothetical protein
MITLVYTLNFGQTASLNLETGLAVISAQQLFIFDSLNSIENLQGGANAERLIGNSSACW